MVSLTTSFCVFQVLSVSVVRALMGMNLGSLKLFENATAVRSWIDQQYKSELATLNLGLVGGLDDPVSSTAAAGTNATAPTYSTQAVGTTSQGKTLFTHRLLLGRSTVPHGSVPPPSLEGYYIPHTSYQVNALHVCVQVLYSEVQGRGSSLCV